MNELSILLEGTAIGSLTRRSDGTSTFSFLKEYQERSERAVLSQSLEDDLSQSSDGVSTFLPPFFSNMLPEGALKAFVLKQHQLDERDEFGLLAALGGDLPGGVVALAAESSGARRNPDPPADRQIGGRFAFSLGGQFLKFSADLVDERVVVPVDGVGGSWILKTPERAFPNLPEVEFVTTRWARASGIETAEQRLVSASDIDGIDPILLLVRPGMPPQQSLCSRRFDRTTDGTARIHYEDFAQVRGEYGELRFDGDYAELVSLIGGLCPEDVRQLVRRLAFMVVSGNGDAHWKNWAVIYADGRSPRLAPAYDLVSTVVYASLARTTALDWMGIRGLDELSVSSMSRIAQSVDGSEDEFAAWISDDISRAVETWTENREEYADACPLAFRITEHLSVLPVAQR